MHVNHEWWDPSNFVLAECMPCVGAMTVNDKRFVYILRSDVDPGHHYVGITSDVRERLDRHNHGPSGHTVSHRPWSLVVTMEFRSEREAARFERYLKSGSGRAFAKRHFSEDAR